MCCAWEYLKQVVTTAAILGTVFTFVDWLYASLAFQLRMRRAHIIAYRVPGGETTKQPSLCQVHYRLLNLALKASANPSTSRPQFFLLTCLPLTDMRVSYANRHKRFISKTHVPAVPTTSSGPALANGCTLCIIRGPAGGELERCLFRL